MFDKLSYKEKLMLVGGIGGIVALVGLSSWLLSRLYSGEALHLARNRLAASEQKLADAHEALCEMRWGLPYGDPLWQLDRVEAPKHEGPIWGMQALKKYGLPIDFDRTWFEEFAKIVGGDLLRGNDGFRCEFEIPLHELLENPEAPVFASGTKNGRGNAIIHVTIISPTPITTISSHDGSFLESMKWATEMPVYWYEWRIVGRESSIIHAQGHSIPGGMAYVIFEDDRNAGDNALRDLRMLFRATWCYLECKIHRETFKLQYKVMFQTIVHPLDR